MDDLISRQAAIDAYGDWYVEEGTEEGFIGTVKQLLEGLPSAQHTAVWELDEQQEHVEKIWHCSNCGYRAWGSYEKTDFCGGCGARMEENSNEN